MSETTNAEKLHIGRDAVVWNIGASIEETALLDPLPDGTEVFEEPQDRMDAAVLVVDTLPDLNDNLDDVLPQLGSVPVVWIAFPITDASGEVNADSISELVSEFGWDVVDDALLDETWGAVRLEQD